MKKIVLLIVVLLLCPSLAQAVTYWVRPGGTMSGCTQSATPPATDSGYKATINAGISCLSGGDTLNIRAGTYDEKVGPGAVPGGPNINTQTIVQGYQSENPIIKPTNNNLVVPGNPWVISTWGQSGQDNITWKNFTIDLILIIGCKPGGPTAGCAVYGDLGGHLNCLLGVDGHRIEGITCLNATRDGLEIFGSNAIVRNNTVLNCGRIPAATQSKGLGFHGSGSNLVIENNTIDNCRGGGIQVDQDGNAVGVIVRNNIIRNYGSGSSHAQSNSPIGCDNNVGYGCLGYETCCHPDGGGPYGTAGCTMGVNCGTPFFPQIAGCITFAHGLNFTAYNNFCYNTTANSIGTSNFSPPWGDDCFYSWGDNYNSHPTLGPNFPGDPGYRTAMRNPRWLNNLCYLPGINPHTKTNNNSILEGYEVPWVVGTVVQNNIEVAGMFLGPLQNSPVPSMLHANFITNPTFIRGNPTGSNVVPDDFRLASGSLGINQGADLSAFMAAIDYLGITRPQQSIWDVGPFEFGGAAVQLLVLEISCDSSLTDASGQGNNGTFQGGATFNTTDKACQLDGKSSISIIGSSSLNFVGDFTLSGWVRSNFGLKDWREIIAKELGGSYWLSGSSAAGACPGSLDGAIAAGYNTATGSVSVCHSVPLTATTWEFIAVSRSSATGVLKLYRGSGSTVNVVSSTTDNALMAPASSSTVRIGAWSDTAEMFPGLIAYVRAYNYELPQTAGAQADMDKCITAPSIYRDMVCPRYPVTTVPPATPGAVKIGSAPVSIGGAAVRMGQ